MLKNIIVYLVILGSAFVFSVYYYMWFSWALLLVILCVPLLSLIVSLPLMIRAAVKGAEVVCPEKVQLLDPLILRFSPKGRCFYPAMSVKVSAKNSFSGRKFSLTHHLCGRVGDHSELVCPSFARNCGTLELRVCRGRVYDFLGLFFLPLRIRQSASADVLPFGEKPAKMPEAGMRVMGYRPKSGGGFADDYELRPYQSGDSIKNIHWKASSKYDELIVREPSLPVYRPLEIVLGKGNSEETDGILCRLAFVTQALAAGNGSYLCRDAEGVSRLIGSEAALERFLIALYRGEPAQLDRGSCDGAIVYKINADGEEVIEP